MSHGADLQGKLEDTRAHNENLTSQLESLRSKSRSEAALAGRLMQDVEASASSARVSEAAVSRESAQRREAEIEAATLRQASKTLEERLQQADAREKRLLSELTEAREGVAKARAEVADLRAENGAMGESLRQCQVERSEAQAQLSATQSQLAARSSDLESERTSLAAARSEVNSLKQQCADAARALQAARASNEALLNGLKQKEEEAVALKRRGQEAAADALGEAEARASAERTVFALREQLSAYKEQKAGLQRMLRSKEAENQQARGEAMQAGHEAQALALRMGLYSATLKSDLAGIVATVC